MSHEDLIEVDQGFWSKMRTILESTREKFEEIFCNETWSVKLSDSESVIELKEEGKDTKVAYEERIEYVKKAIGARLKENRLQCEAIKRGFSKIIPEALLNMLTFNELETWVCGKAIVDVDLLKRHTKYGGDQKTIILNENSRRIKWFWEVLREFSEEDK